MTTLAEFIRARRDHLKPGDVGLPDNGRRRTPGLRREEVATLAGVSVDYLVRLEQGRDTHPSASVVAALAAALRLSEDERGHLWKLAAIGASPELCPAARPLESEVAPTVRAMLERLTPTPAFVVGPSNDVLAWNTAWDQLVRPLGTLDDEGDGHVPNLARYVFLHSMARSVYRDWVAAADEQVSRLRAATHRWGEDERFVSLMADLHATVDFEQRWSAYGVTEKHRGTKQLGHPELGELRVSYEVLLLPDDDEQRLVTWLPGDDATEAAFASVSGTEVPVSPAQLRVIS